MSCQKESTDASLQFEHPVIETICIRTCFGRIIFMCCYFGKVFHGSDTILARTTAFAASSR